VRQLLITADQGARYTPSFEGSQWSAMVCFEAGTASFSGEEGNR